MAESRRQEGHIALWEKVIGWIGVLFVVGLVGFLVYEAQQPATPPEITVTVTGIVPVEGGYRVEVAVQNRGESTGAGVEVEGTLMPKDDPQATPVATGAVTFDYVPAKSTRRGGLFFPVDPNSYTLTVRALGYTEP